MKRIFILLPAILLISFCTAQQTKAAEGVRVPASDSAYYFIRGYEAEMSHKWDEAEQFYRKALEIDPLSVHLKVQLAYVLFRTGNTAEVMELTDSILKDNPDSVPALKLKAELYKDKKQYRDAAQIYDRLTELEPDNTEMLFMAGVL